MVASLKNRLPSSENRQTTIAADSAQVFNFAEFFHGHTRASGWFSDRFGKPRRHFCGDFYGHYDDSQFVLDEKLYYSDGIFEERVWRISIGVDGSFGAESPSLIGAATGQITGNTLAMKYSMKVKVEEGKEWALNMKDLMVLQPDGSLHNITQVSKWGLRIGTVSAQYLHHDGDKLCVDVLTEKGLVQSTDIPARHLASVSR